MSKTYPFVEQQYLDILTEIKEEGVWKPVRQVSKVTGEPLRAKTVSGTRIIIPQDAGVPLISLRNLRGAFYKFIGEMLWILSGSTSVADLHLFGVDYWDDWCTPEKCGWYGLSPGEFGRTYGAQWRSFNAGTSEPIDQIERLLRKIEENPHDRSLMVHPWNPYDVDHLVVKPCHGAFHLILMDNCWEMVVDQRSADVPVGIAANLVMYYFLLELICMKTGFKRGKITYNIRDTHYYSDQEEGVEILLERVPKSSPAWNIDPVMVEILDQYILGNPDPIKEFSMRFRLSYQELLKVWIKLEGYSPCKPIPYAKLPVAI